ncbi:MAG: hypothetical protein IJB70_06760 [Clostridia bacterium]|nr:hypothetical protein [Clostridia bacterium]
MTEKNVSKDMIHKYMIRYRIKFAIIEAVVVIALVAYFLWCKPYIMNKFEGASSFDETKFANEAGTVSIAEEVEIRRNDNLFIPSYTIKSWGYWQEDKYEFEVPLEGVKLTDIKYTMKTTDDTNSSNKKGEESSKLYTAEVGGKKVLVLAYPHHNLKSGDTVDGIFTKIPLIINHDISNSNDFKAGEQICEYMLDIRGLEMENEQFDTLVCAILLICALYLAVKLLLQFKNHRRTPTYSQLEKYGDCDSVEKEIAREIEQGYYFKGKWLVTENWIISKDWFKLKIVKNHMAKGKFEYVDLGK